MELNEGGITMKIKAGDIITVTALYFQNPEWTEGSPCVLLSPVLMYSEGASADGFIEDILIGASCRGEFPLEDSLFVDESLQWAGKSLNAVKRAVSKSFELIEQSIVNLYGKDYIRK
jgi:hypothetical protein